MKKVIIMGNSGSGKTWLGIRMAEIMKSPYFCLDRIFWEPGGYNRKRNDIEVEADLEKIQKKDAWLTEGVFGHLIDNLISYADTLIYTDLPWDECKENLMNRGSESSKQLDPSEAKENFQALLKWASEYDIRDGKASKKYHSMLFENFAGRKFLVKNRDDIDQLLNNMKTDQCHNIKCL